MSHKTYKNIVVAIGAGLFLPSAHAAGLGVDLVVDLQTTRGTPEYAVEAALAQLCPDLAAANSASLSSDQQQLLGVCNNYSGATAEERGMALKNMSSRSASAETSVGNYLPGGTTMPNLSKRLSVLRRAAQRSSIAALPQQPIMVAALGSVGLDDGAATPVESAFSAFANLNLANFEQDETSYEAGFQGAGKGLVLGGDYRFNNRLFAGAALNYGNNDMDMAANSGTLAMSDLGLTFYGTLAMSDAVYVNGIFNYGNQSYEMKRRVNFVLNGTTYDTTTSSKPSGNQMGLALSSGWQSTVGTGTSLDVNGTLYYGKAAVDAFSESDGGAFNLVVDKQQVDTMRLNLGADISRAFSTGAGVLLPQFTLNMVHEFSSDGQDITAHFAADPGNGGVKTFTYTTEERDADYFTLALGVSLLSAGGVTSYLNYDTILAMENYTQRNFSLGVRMEF